MSALADEASYKDAESEPQMHIFEVEEVDAQFLPDSHITESLLTKLTRLYDLTDWRVVLLDGATDRDYAGIPTISFYKALALSYLVNIPTERALGRMIRTKESLQQLCGFSKKNLPGERTLWHFRNKYSKVYDLLMLKVLVALVLSGKEPNLHLPFVTQAAEEIDTPGSHQVTITLDKYRPPIIITTLSTVTYQKDHQDTSVSDPEILEFQQRWQGKFHSKQLQEYSKKAEAYNQELEHLAYRRSLPMFSGKSLLPAWIETRFHSGEEISFGIHTPDWMAPSNNLELLTEELGVNARPQRSFDRACNILVFRNSDRRELLLSKRKDKGYGANTYAFPGGKQRPDETLEECAQRELKEETDLDIKKSKPVSLFHTRTKEFGTVLSVGVLAIDYEGELKTMEPDHHEAWDWYDTNNLPGPLFEPTKIALQQYREKIYPELEWSQVETPWPRQLGLFEDVLHKAS